MSPQTRRATSKTDPDNSEARKLVILFAHGLESGPSDPKVQQLKIKGESEFVVVAPDMRPLIQTARKRIFWRLLFPSAVVAVYIGAMLYKDYEKAKVPCAFIVAVALVACPLQFIMLCRLCLGECVNLQLNQFWAHKPDLIIGSSFGGAVIARLLCSVNHSLYRGPILLLAPSQFRLDWFTWLGDRAFTNYPSETTVLVVHGNKDAVVPLADSERLVQMISKLNRAELLVVNDQHTLQDTYKQHHREWIQRALDLHQKKGINAC
jgi:Serine hydrolase (FSH1)